MRKHKKCLLEEYNTAIKSYENIITKDEKDYFRGQIILLENMINRHSKLHKKYFK